MTKEYILSKLHVLYRSDPWVNEVFAAVGLSMDEIADVIQSVYDSNWFDTMDEACILRYEAKMGLTPGQSQTLNDRRSAIEAKWKSSGIVNLELIQAVANSWKNGEVNCSFTGGKIYLTFNSIFGVPADLQSLLDAIDDVKPAHLAIAYTLKYLLIRDIEGEKTLTEMEALTMNQFAGGDA